MKAGQVREIVVSSLFSTCVVGLLAQFVLLERELEFTGGKHLKFLLCFFIYVGNLDEFAAALMRRLNDDRGGGGVRQVEPAMPTEEEEEEVNTISRFNRSFFPSSILFSVANLHLFRPTEPWGGSDLGEKFCRGALTNICFNCAKQTSDGQEEEDGGGGLGPRGLRWVLRDGEAARGLRPPTVHVGVILRNLARASTAHKSRRLREQFVTMLLRYEDENKSFCAIDLRELDRSLTFLCKLKQVQKIGLQGDSHLSGLPNQLRFLFHFRDEFLHGTS